MKYNISALNKSAIVVLLLCNHAIIAGTMGPVCTAGAVTVPCPSTGWEFGIQGLYLNQTFEVGSLYTVINATGIDGHVSFTNEVTHANTNSSTNGGAFKLQGAYLFKQGNDLNLNWYHYNNASNKQVLQGSSPLSFIEDTIFSDDDFYSNVAVHLKTQWDAINLELGQYINLSELATTRLHGGFQYANIRTNYGIRATSASTAAAAGSSIDAAYVSATSNYNGFGPRVGADLMYGLNHGFSLYANAATALLVGRQIETYSDLGTTTSVALTNFGIPIGTPETSYNTSYNNPVVLDVDAKVGATYNHAMAHGSITLDAGWMWALYIAPLKSLGNFGVQGPYVGLKWLS